MALPTYSELVARVVKLEAAQAAMAAQDAETQARVQADKALDDKLAALDSYTREGLVAAGDGLTDLYIKVNRAANDSERAIEKLGEVQGKLSELGQRVETADAELRGELGEVSSELAQLNTKVDSLTDAMSNDLEGVFARLAALETPQPPPVIVVEDGPLVVRDETAEIRLEGRTIAGIALEPYHVRQLSIVGPGKILPKPGVHGVDLRKMAGGGVASVTGGIEIVVEGDDISTIYAPEIARLALADLLLRAKQQKTADRHARPANVQAARTATEAARIVAIGGNSSFHAPNAASMIRDSFLSPQQFAVNGWGATGGRLLGSLVVPLGSGRGWLCEATTDCEMSDCVALALDRAPLDNAPRGWMGAEELDGYAARIRYGARRCRIARNWLLSIGGGPSLAGATAAGLHEGSTDPEQANEIVNNWLGAISLGGPLACQALNVQSTGSAAATGRDRIRGNACASNMHLLSSTGTDNASGVWMGEPISGCTWNWMTADEIWSDWLLAADAMLGRLNLGEAASRRFAECLAAVPHGVVSAGLHPERKSWRTGAFSGVDEDLSLVGPSGNATWGANDYTATGVPGRRRLVIDGRELVGA